MGGQCQAWAVFWKVSWSLVCGAPWSPGFCCRRRCPHQFSHSRILPFSDQIIRICYYSTWTLKYNSTFYCQILCSKYKLRNCGNEFWRRKRSGRVAFFSNLFEHDIPSRTRTQRSSLIPWFLINPQVRIHILLQICHGKPFRFSWIFTGCFQIMLDPIFLSFLGYRKTYI